MPNDQQDHPMASGSAAGADVPFGSNEVRLSWRQWLLAAGLLAVAFTLTPRLWKRVEPLGAGPDWRVPYRLGHDYWLYARWCRRAGSRHEVLVVGDSVVWGHYVRAEQTLSHYLSRGAGGPRFANLGVDGIHPAAMAGLLEHYGRAISGKRVLLHCNLLWMSSPASDLQGRKERSFNHPQLVPQLSDEIPCYREPLSGRLGIVVRRRLSVLQWARHLRIAYFDGSPLGWWTLEHPYANPVRAVTLRLPSPNEPPSPKPVAKPWTQQGMGEFDAPWVDLGESIQWRFFRRCVEVLRRRGNRVFVLVGPFNEHMLTESSLRAYRRRKQQVGAWLRRREVPHLIPEALPSERYADASHPLGAGYAVLAERLLAEEAFRRFGHLAAAGPSAPSRR